VTLEEREAAALEELEWELSAPHTQEAIAERLGMSQPGILFVERRALKKLRKLASGHGWEDGLRDPPRNHTGLNDRFADDGMSPRRGIG
jgi:hypothetical protein